MTHVKTLYIGPHGANVTLDCGHDQQFDRMVIPPRPGSDYDCPDCRAEVAQALAEQFTSVELARLRFWQWMRLTGRAGA